MDRSANAGTDAARTSTNDALTARVLAVTTAAAKHADDVDAKGRFPREAVDAMREAKLLSAAVPADLGGDGHGMRELATGCTAVARACGSSGMVLAMHHIQVACVARHGRSSPWFEAYLREIAARQLVLASITSEVGTDGDTRASVCAVERNGDRFTLNKDGTTVSYGEHADDLLVTSRRAPDAERSDQVLVVVRKGDYTLQPLGKWDAMGMRGTCSPPAKLTSTGPVAQIVPGSFADSSAQTMVPYSHILWSAVWLGIASDAVARAAAFVRGEARRKPGTIPETAPRLAEVSSDLQAMRHHVTAVAEEFDALGDDRNELSTMRWALKLNNLKMAISESAPRIVHKALQVIGIRGYRNDSPFSVGRHYRDALSAALMISNARVASKSASLLLVLKDE